jgi:tRNA threonylcarbamoyladenosine modification (KEOPS) complex  Pcc1 subunit
MYQSNIIVSSNIDAIEKLFIPEDRKLNRASYTVRKDNSKKHLVFDIRADDATALKTAFNTITKVLLVWEKTRELKNG